MDKKGVTIVSTVGIILATICVVYIFLNAEIDKPKIEEKIEEIQQEIIGREERSQNIILTSRTGLKLSEFIRFSNIYSTRLTDELDENGISNKFKILASFEKILLREEYQDLVGYSQTYSNTYVLASNMKKVINNSFEDNEYKKESVDGILYYDEATDSYAMINNVVRGIVEDFVVEVPYKMTQYENRVEVYAYRLYIKQTIENIEDKDTVVTDVYYDKAKSKNAISFSNINEFYESNQVNFLKEQIDNKAILDSKMERVKYTLVEENNMYKFKSFENI